jgi:hypothetical protein
MLLAAAQGLAPVGARRPLEALAEVATFRGELADALAHYERAIREWQQAGAWTPLWVTLRTLVDLLARADARADAAVLDGAVTSASSGAPPFGADADRLRQSLPPLPRISGMIFILNLLLRT